MPFPPDKRCMKVLFLAAFLAFAPAAHAGWMAIADFSGCPSQYVSGSGQEGPFASAAACQARLNSISTLACARYRCVESGGGGGGGHVGGGGGSGLTQQQQLGLQMMQTMLTAMFQNDPEADARRQEQLRLEEEARQRRLEEERRAAEERHRKVQGEMLGRDDAPSLTLLRDDAPAVGGGTPQLLRTDENPGSAPGHRVVDCAGAKTIRDRLQKGLDGQLKVIEKTEEQLKAAKESSKDAKEEAARTAALAAVKEATVVAKDTAKEMEKLKKVLEKLKLANKVPPEKARKLIEGAVELHDLADANVKKYKSFKAGKEYQEKMSEGNYSLTKHLNEYRALLVESGIAEEGGEMLAETAGGPVGALAFRAAKTGIDLGAAGYQVYFSEKEAAMAERNLSIMKDELARSNSRIYELNQDLCSKECGGTCADRP